MTTSPPEGSAKELWQAAYALGLSDMQERAAKQADKRCEVYAQRAAETLGDDEFYLEAASCELRQLAAAIRALPKEG